MAASPDRRQRLLRTLDVVPWRLRDAPAAPVPGPKAANDAPPAAGTVACVVVLPVASEREMDLIGRALRAFGPVLGRAARLHVGEHCLGPVPVAGRFLVFGEAQAHALGRELPAAALQAAQIVLVDTPSAVLTSPQAKRRLWQGLRTLARSLPGA